MNNLKQELSGTKAYEQTSAKERSVINHHIFQTVTGFGDFLHSIGYLNCTNNHISLDLLRIQALNC